ncbi:leucine-rich repeat-containing protein 71-like [Amyelois transitella]|uniref:leucine-rich repeat-containing protein 71-like n=1 Tax=Amyelois transitella TaxID=680683 RepID=UPI00299002D2|nr:leucine-rich repeat-containing protein 71-like [Amyelois transitella]
MKLAGSSTRSLRSRRSVLTDKAVSYKCDREYENIQEFEVCFPDLCRKYGFPWSVYVKKETVRDEYLDNQNLSKPKGKLKQKDKNHPPSLNSTRDTATTASTEFQLDEDTLVITSLYDNCNRFVELFLHKLDEIPPELIKLIGFLARYYTDLKRIKIQFCRIDANTIFELSKLFSLSSLTEVDLDGSIATAGNYGILLDNSRVINISLSKCRINDPVCEIIASKLCFQGPAERTLCSLNLSSNHITDTGAKYLSNALRSNRTLRYLNLADNRITDEGACGILESLKEFPLTREESLNKKQRYMDYEKQRLAYYFKYLEDFDKQHIEEIHRGKSSERSKSMSSRKSSRPSTARPQKERKDIKVFTFDDYKTRAEMLAGEMMGPFHDPYQFNNVKIRDEKCYSIGNLTLCYLNLAFNNLSYHSVVKLLDVLQYQKDTKRQGQIGLMRVILKGNDIPISCAEYIKIDEMLNKCMMTSGGRAFTEFSAKRKSRLSRVSMIPEKVLLSPR